MDRVNICIKEDWLDWLRVVQHWLSCFKTMARECSSCSSRSLPIPAVSIWCWRPGGLLKSCGYSVSTGILKKLVLISAKECLSNSLDELASKSDHKRAKGKFSFFHVLLSRLLQESVVQILFGFSCFKWYDQENSSQESKIVKVATKISHHTHTYIGIF